MKQIVPLAVFLVLAGSGLADHYFRDEFYYLACSHRMAWGYVDQPPLSIAVLWLIRHVFGDSLLVLRCTAGVVAASAVWLAGRLAQRFGASGFGQAMAMTAAAVAPALLSLGSFYSMNVFDVFFWTLAALILIDAIEAPSAWRWTVLGAVLGLGLLNKISVLWLGAGIAAGLASTPARRLLLTPGPWIAAIVAALIFTPHVLWQMTHTWPTLEFIRNASAEKMQSNTPLQFVADQVMNMHPATLPIWLAGLLYLLVHPAMARFRPLGVAFLTVAAILIVNRTSRSGYLAPGYIPLFAAGGALLERQVRSSAVRSVLLALLVFAGLVSAPLALPLLPVDSYVRYSGALGVAPDTEEKKELARLPQFFADRQGWDRLVDQVAAVFERLSPDERASAAVLTGNYGEAGAIEHLGRSRGLRAISGHNNYWLWGPSGHTGDVLIVLSRSRERQEQRFSSVELAGEIDCGDCMPYENHLSIFVGRGMKPPPLADRWAAFKHYN
jgi:hypothetical protein